MKIIVPVSGGKDSQCCLKMAIEEHGSDNVIGVFCDTGFEHPKTYAHIDKMTELYDCTIYTIKSSDVLSECLKYKRFPSVGSRFCTSLLKIEPTIRFLKRYGQEHGEAQVWYGMRMDESQSRNKRFGYKDPDELYPPKEIMPMYPTYLHKKYNILFRLPVVDWTREEIMEYLDGEQNPLYNEGFERVGCFPCLASGDMWKIKSFAHDRFGGEQLIKIRMVEEEIGKTMWSTNLGKAFDIGCTVGRGDNMNIEALEDSSQGCRICEI